MKNKMEKHQFWICTSKNRKRKASRHCRSHANDPRRLKFTVEQSPKTVPEGGCTLCGGSEIETLAPSGPNVALKMGISTAQRYIGILLVLVLDFLYALVPCEGVYNGEQARAQMWVFFSFSIETGPLNLDTARTNIYQFLKLNIKKQFY